VLQRAQCAHVWQGQNGYLPLEGGGLVLGAGYIVHLTEAHASMRSAVARLFGGRELSDLVLLLLFVLRADAL
jgi:hypothetical protein